MTKKELDIWDVQGIYGGIRLERYEKMWSVICRDRTHGFIISRGRKSRAAD